MPNDKNQSKFENYSLSFNGNDEFIDLGDFASLKPNTVYITLYIVHLCSFDWPCFIIRSCWSERAAGSLSSGWFMLFLPVSCCYYLVNIGLLLSGWRLTESRSCKRNNWTRWTFRSAGMTRGFVRSMRWFSCFAYQKLRQKALAFIFVPLPNSQGAKFPGGRKQVLGVSPKIRSSFLFSFLFPSTLQKVGLPGF